MKKYLIFFILLPLFADAQAVSNGYNFGGLIGVLIGVGIAILIFLALRALVLWYWKVNIIVAYQEQNINALQSIYNSQEQLLKVAKEQAEILRGISEKLNDEKLPKG